MKACNSPFKNMEEWFGDAKLHFPRWFLDIAVVLASAWILRTVTQTFVEMPELRIMSEILF